MKPEYAAELIARITADAAGFEPSIQAFDALRRSDITLALSMVSSLPARLLVRIKYADQTRYVGTFEDELISAIERGMLLKVVDSLALPEEWRIPRKDFVRDMCRMALAEYLNPKLCPRCEGRGSKMARKGKLKVNCERCGGSGKRLGTGQYEDKERAILIGMHPDNWRRRWRERYRAIQSLIDLYNDIGLGGMAKRLSY